MTVHRTRPPTRVMRESPDIDQLKRQARELLEAYRAQSAGAVIEVAAHHRTATPETFALHIVAQEEKRGAHGANAFGDGLGRLRHAMLTGGEEAVIAVFESAAAFGRWDYLVSCPLDSLQGKGLLQAAVRNDRPAVLRQLLEMGLDPDERTQIGQHEDQTFSSGGPLLEAVNTGRIEMARVLLELRAPESGQTMLHEVIARDHGVGLSLASILLDAGAHTDVRDEFLKSTPLGWACRWGRVELVKLLLARGADPIEREAEPWATPLAWAERRQHAGIAAILRQHGADR